MTYKIYDALDIKGNRLTSGPATVNGVELNSSIETNGQTLYSFQPYIQAESITYPANFSVTSGLTYANVTDTSVPFSKCLYIAKNVNIYSSYIPVQAGDILYGEIWIMRETGATGTEPCTAYFGIERFDKDLKPIASNSGMTYFVISNQVITADSVWRKYSATSTLPLTHTPYNGSDGGAVRYVRIRTLLNYSAGTVPTYYGGMLIKSTSMVYDSSFNSIPGTLSIGTKASPSNATLNIEHPTATTFGVKITNALSMDTTSSGAGSAYFDRKISQGTTATKSVYNTWSKVSYDISSGFTNAGSIFASYSGVFRNYNAAGTDDSGTVSSLTGMLVQYGHFNTNVSTAPITTAVYGMRIQPYARTGTIETLYGIYLEAIDGSATVTTKRGIYQIASDMPNVLKSSLTVGAADGLSSITGYGTLDIQNATVSTHYVDSEGKIRMRGALNFASGATNYAWLYPNTTADRLYVTLASGSHYTVPLIAGVNKLTASRVAITDANSDLASSSVTSTELGYVSGVTSAIQTQIDGKASSTHVLDSASHSISGKTAGQILLATADTTYAFTTISGDATVAGTGALTIASNAVTFAKLQQSASAGLSVIGRSTNTAGNFAEIAAVTSGHVLRLNSTTLGFGTLLSTSFANNTIAYARLTYSAVGGFLGHSGTTSSALTMISSSTQYHVPQIGASSGLSFDYLTGNNFGSAITANYVLAAPNGSTGAPSFRSLVAADIPNLNSSYVPYTGATQSVDLGSWWLTTTGTIQAGVFQARPAGVGGTSAFSTKVEGHTDVDFAIMNGGSLEWAYNGLGVPTSKLYQSNNAELSVTGALKVSTSIYEGGTTLASKYAALSHTHGNITSAGAIGSTANLPIITTTSGVLTTGSFGTTSGTFAAGNHTHGNITTAGAIGSTANLPIITTTAGALTTGSFGTTSGTFASGDHNHSGIYQPLDADLTSIAGLAGTTGVLTKTAADTWELDTTPVYGQWTILINNVNLVSGRDYWFTYSSGTSAIVEGDGGLYEIEGYDYTNSTNVFYKSIVFIASSTGGSTALVLTHSYGNATYACPAGVAWVSGTAGSSTYYFGVRLNAGNTNACLRIRKLSKGGPAFDGYTTYSTSSGTVTPALMANATQTRMINANGYLDFGPRDTTYCHFDTDRSTYLFNKPAVFDGEVGVYLGNSTSFTINLTGLNTENLTARKGAGGMCHLKGGINKGTVSIQNNILGTLVTIPSGFRPITDQYAICMASGAVGAAWVEGMVPCKVTSGGAFVIMGANGFTDIHNVRLDNISYMRT